VWLLLVAVALGGAVVWCSQFTMSSGLQFNIPSSATALPLSWSLDVAILAWLPATFLVWFGLIVAMRDIEDRTGEEEKKTSEAYQARLMRCQQQEEKRKRAALNNMKHLIHLRDSMHAMCVRGVC
jgi:hypothetical protein